MRAGGAGGLMVHRELADPDTVRMVPGDLGTKGGAVIDANGALVGVITEGDLTSLKWSKAPCRYCGTGYGVNVAVRDGRVVATHGDVQSEVNRGINCVKGYFLSKVMYGHDRLTQPLLRKSNGRYDKNGAFTPVSWD